jgi:hypothetical protein
MHEGIYRSKLWKEITKRLASDGGVGGRWCMRRRLPVSMA